ncbi:MAG: hypothetical protein ACLRXA_22985 [Clostridium sp.]
MAPDKRDLLIENTAGNIDVTENIKYRHAVHYWADEGMDAV